MAAPSKTTALRSVLNVASTLTEILDTFSNTLVAPIPQRPQPKPRPPPLALPRARTLLLPLSRVKIPLKVSQEFKSIYLAKIKQLRRVAQDEYSNLCKSLTGIDLANMAKLLRTSYRASEEYFAQQAIDACLDAHALATNSQRVETVTQVKKPFDRTIAAIFEYIFDQPEGNFLNPVDKWRLAELSGMTDRQITVWFQNRRARTKQKIATGKVVEQMTLDKAMVKLRADCEKARLAKIKSTAFRTIVFKRTEKVLIDEAEEQSGHDVVCPRDQQDLDLRQQYATGALPNFDVVPRAPGSFPQPFVMPDYVEPRFAAPVWPRASRSYLHKPINLVTKQEVDELATILDDVVELRRTRTQVTRRRVTFPLPLPQIVQEAVARRDAARIRDGKKPKSMAPQPHPVDEANRAKIQAITSNAEELLKFNIKRNQVQIKGPQIISDRVLGHLSDQMTGMGLEYQPYVAPPLPPTVDTLSTELSQTDLNKQHPESEASETDQESGSEFWDDSIRSDVVVIPSLSTFLEEGNDGSEPEDLLIPHELEMGSETRVHPADYPPAINTGPDYIPIDNVLMDSYTMNEALKMTLKELRWKGPLPANIDEPFVFNHVPSLAPNLSEASLSFIEYTQRHQVDIHLPENAAFMDLGGEMTFDPTTVPDSAPPPPSASAPFPYFAHSDDTSVLSREVYDLPNNPLPFALSNSAIQHSALPGLWELSASHQYHNLEDALFTTVDPTPQPYNNVDMSVEPTFDQYSDPQGSTLPFALTDPTTFDISYYADTSVVPTFDQLLDPQGTTLPFAFYDQSTAYPSPLVAELTAYEAPHILPSQESALDAVTKFDQTSNQDVSFYPSYLPQVPIITREVHRAARGVHRWLEKLTGIKLQSAPFIDPEAMLQYLS